MAAVQSWVEQHVPAPWVEAGRRGGAAQVRTVRRRADYEAWYPLFGASGLVVPTWPIEYGGLDLAPDVARRVDEVLRPYNLGRLNPLGLNLAAPRLRPRGRGAKAALPPTHRAQRGGVVPALQRTGFGIGPGVAGHSSRARRRRVGDHGQKVWTTWAHLSSHAVLLARTDPDVPKRAGSRTSCWSSRSPVWMSVRCGTWAAKSTSTRCSSMGHGCRTRIESARSARGGRSRTPPCRGNARWCRVRVRAVSTASAGRAPTRSSVWPAV